MPTIEFHKRRFQTVLDISLSEKAYWKLALKIKHSPEEDAQAYWMSCEIKTPRAGDDGDVATQERKVCDIETEIATLGVKGSA